MTELPSGWTLALILALISFAAHEPWRWAGMFLGRNIDIESELFQWVRAVSTALVAALVVRLVVFPAGALGGVPWGIRAIAMAAGVGVYVFGGRRIAAGVGAAAAALVLGQLLTG